jgi:hypothetical protein
MKDHLKTIRLRLTQIEREESARVREIATLRAHGRVLVDYLTLLSGGITATEASLNKVRAALREFGRYTAAPSKLRAKQALDAISGTGGENG